MNSDDVITSEAKIEEVNIADNQATVKEKQVRKSTTRTYRYRPLSKPTLRDETPEDEEMAIDWVAAKRVCFELCMHGNLTRVCAEHPELPDRKTIYVWAARNTEFCKKLEIARLQGLNASADSFIDFVQAALPDDAYFTDEKGRRRVDNGWVSHKKMTADKMVWLYEKFLPRIYNRTNIFGEDEVVIFRTASLPAKEFEQSALIEHAK